MILSYYVDKYSRVWSVYSTKALLLKPTLTVYGYAQFGIRGKSIRAHRFIWEYFNEPIPKNLQINHKNGIKTDNRLENLELVTAKANVQHALRTGLMVRKSKIDLVIKKRIRRLYKTGKYSNTDLAEIYGVSASTIRNIIHHRY